MSEKSCGKEWADLGESAEVLAAEVVHDTREESTRPYCFSLPVDKLEEVITEARWPCVGCLVFAMLAYKYLNYVWRDRFPHVWYHSQAGDVILWPVGCHLGASGQGEWTPRSTVHRWHTHLLPLPASGITWSRVTPETSILKTAISVKKKKVIKTVICAYRGRSPAKTPGSCLCTAKQAWPLVSAPGMAKYL